jgi:hypothetical protein
VLRKKLAQREGIESGVGVVVVLEVEVKVEVNVRKYFPAPTQLIARIVDSRFTERRGSFITYGNHIIIQLIRSIRTPNCRLYRNYRAHNPRFYKYVIGSLISRFLDLVAYLGSYSIPIFETHTSSYVAEEAKQNAIFFLSSHLSTYL